MILYRIPKKKGEPMAPEFNEGSISTILENQDNAPYIFAREGANTAFEKMTDEDLDLQWKKIAKKYRFFYPHRPDDKGIFRVDIPRKSIVVGPDEGEADRFERRTTIQDMSQTTESLGIKTVSWQDSINLMINKPRSEFSF